KESGAEAVAPENAVDIGSANAAVAAHRSIGAPIDPKPWLSGVPPGSVAEMNFIAFDRKSGFEFPARDWPHGFLPREHRFHVQHPESFDASRPAFHAMRIGDPAPKQLKAAADSENRAALPDMCRNVDVPAFGTQICEIGGGGLRA